jgi:hypothetical protein
MNPLPYHKSPQTRQMLRLVNEAVLSNSFLPILGQEGTGRTYFGRWLERKHLSSADDRFPWKPCRYECISRVDAREALRDLIMLLNPTAKPSGDRVSRLMAQFVDAVRTSDTSLLYLNKAHRFKAHDREPIMEAVQAVREERQFGVVMTAGLEYQEFRDMGLLPNALTTVVLNHLDPTENLHGMKAHDPRFASWTERLKAREPEMVQYAERLKAATHGNFDRVRSICASLRAHIPGDTLSFEQVDKVLALRATRFELE